MRLLVTGGAGFIGSRVVEAALRDGAEVRVLDSFRDDVHGAAPTLPDGAEVIRGDVRDPQTLDRALERVDAVSHQAAKVGLGVDFADAPDYVGSNVLATAELLAAMRRADVRRLVLASSMVVYGEGVYTVGGDGPTIRPAARRVADLEAGVFDPRDPVSGCLLTPGPVGEDTAADPRNVYATTKLAQEHLAANWARETGGAVAALRYHNVYGPGMPRNTPYAGVASLFRSALERGEAPRVFEDGAQRRDFVHVDDVAAANIAALGWTGTVGEATARPFNVASGHVVSIGEVAGILSEAAGGDAPVVTGEYRRGDVRHITASATRAREELGWRAAVPPQTGLRQFATAPLRA
ncbi:NAD-dependent epimerase/dehydratase family protein [Microbacterium aquimaris]|uniref:NAD-dependent epimerase/dehydratase family protein n=1 Tax=Microbacterium aquimaris TaxID=459816 RepID=A0ABU5N860_9MICO|nr:NAD-dependent epimerase/dehydratase family protein [Microbacterium aquimaris]MDZ8162265.1 NAD-dependent epimerase/dehydratase family protein [Microbacterium aquimaris]